MTYTNVKELVDEFNVKLEAALKDMVYVEYVGMDGDNFYSYIDKDGVEFDIISYCDEPKLKVSEPMQIEEFD